ncbi:unnamed protein product [Gulo gulo]|uniref:Uncharacterized protein n=1 Tax=Gulo gulo TaxID=48420 RepID=A0A9X9LL51_GULGU|nr:unnamed protein product [Gulo gulo]
MGMRGAPSGEQQAQRALSRPDRVGFPPSADHVCLWSPDRAVTWPCSQPMSLPTMASPTLSPDSSSQEALSAPTCSPTSDSENLSPDELELLAKLEEQNRLLEADSKSMRSMNGSRRNSGSSLVSSSSASSNLSHLEEDTWILWGRIANEWEEWRRRKEKLLKVGGACGAGRGQLGPRVAAPVQRHRHAGQEPVLGAAQDVLAVREADPQGHCPHLPRARVLQGPGQPGPGGPLQRHEGVLPGGQGGGLLPGQRLHRGPAPHADARGRSLLCVRAADAGVPSAGALQAQHGGAGALHLPVRVHAPGAAPRSEHPLPLPELPHVHVRLILVSHTLPHYLPAPRCHPCL